MVMGTVCVQIIISVIMSFIAPFFFAGAAAILSAIFKAFTNPFQFVTGTGQTNWFTTILSPELLNVIVKIMIAAGVVLSIFILAKSIFQLFFAGMVKKVDTPIATCIRAVIAIFLAYWIIDIMYNAVFPIFQWLLNKVNGIGVSGVKTIGEAVSDFFTTANTSGSSIVQAIMGENATGLSIFTAIASSMTFETFGSCLTLIIFIVFLFKVIVGLFRIVSEMAERFLLINVLTVFSPMVASTIISDSTMPIFISWVQMMVANGLVLIFNSLGMTMLKMGFINVGIACSAFGGDWSRALIAMIVYNALIKVVQQFDVYLAQLTFKIQAVGGNQRTMTFGNMLHLTAATNKSLSNIASVGGIKNAAGAAASNVLGFFTGNRTGVAGKLNQGAVDYMAKTKGRDKAFGKLMFEESAEGKEARARNMDIKLADARDPDMIGKKTEMEAQKARNNAAMFANAEYQDAAREAEVADMSRKTSQMSDAEYVEAATDMEAAKRSLDAQVLASAEVQDAAAEQKAADLDLRTHVMEDPAVQDAQLAHDVTRMEATASEQMSREYIEASKEAALSEEFVRHEVGETGGVQTIRVENEARAMDIRSRAGDTDLGVDAQVRTIKSSERARDASERERFNRHAEESEAGNDE